MAGSTTAPASAQRRMLSSCTSDSGVSRGTRISLRRSFRCTSAARWIRLPEAPWAIALSVPPEQGQTTMPSVRDEPLAIGGKEILIVVIADTARLGRVPAAVRRATVLPGVDADQLAQLPKAVERGQFLASGSRLSRLELLEIDVQAQLLAQARLAGRADRELHVAAGGHQHVQQPHGVNRAAGAGDGQDDVAFHFTPTYKVATPRVSG